MISKEFLFNKIDLRGKNTSHEDITNLSENINYIVFGEDSTKKSLEKLKMLIFSQFSSPLSMLTSREQEA